MIKILVLFLEKCLFDLKYGRGNWRNCGEKWGKMGSCGETHKKHNNLRWKVLNSD